MADKRTQVKSEAIARAFDRNGTPGLAQTEDIIDIILDVQELTNTADFAEASTRGVSSGARTVAYIAQACRISEDDRFIIGSFDDVDEAQRAAVAGTDRRPGEAASGWDGIEGSGVTAMTHGDWLLQVIPVTHHSSNTGTARADAYALAGVRRVVEAFRRYGQTMARERREGIFQVCDDLDEFIHNSALSDPSSSSTSAEGL